MFETSGTPSPWSSGLWVKCGFAGGFPKIAVSAVGLSKQVMLLAA
jgi:hypothetical protein